MDRLFIEALTKKGNIDAAKIDLIQAAQREYCKKCQAIREEANAAKALEMGLKTPPGTKTHTYAAEMLKRLQEAK